MKMIISLGQMDVILGRPAENEAKVSDWTREAARLGSHLVLFPELWGSGYDLENFANLASPIDAGLFLRMSALAKEYHLYVAGSLLESDQGGLYNTLALYSPDGSLAGSYRKVHLFGLMTENKWLCAGHRLAMAQSPWGPVGLSICYDLRFPELYRRYATQGAVITLIPAEWPAQRITHWQTLLRARAIEDLMVVAAANRVGTTPTDTFGGASAIIDPWGKTIIEGTQAEALLTGEVDLDLVGRVRRKLSVLEDQRPDIYSGELLT